MDLKAPKLCNMFYVKNSQKRHQVRTSSCCERKDIVFSVYLVLAFKIKANIAMGNVKYILFANVSHMKNI